MYDTFFITLVHVHIIKMSHNFCTGLAKLNIADEMNAVLTFFPKNSTTLTFMASSWTSFTHHVILTFSPRLTYVLVFNYLPQVLLC